MRDWMRGQLEQDRELCEHRERVDRAGAYDDTDEIRVVDGSLRTGTPTIREILKRFDPDLALLVKDPAYDGIAPVALGAVQQGLGVEVDNQGTLGERG